MFEKSRRAECDACHVVVESGIDEKGWSTNGDEDLPNGWAWLELLWFDNSWERQRWHLCDVCSLKIQYVASTPPELEVGDGPVP